MKVQTLIASLCATLLSSAALASAPAATPNTTLPAARITDSSMDLNKTMKTMGRHFKALNQAGDILAAGADVDALLTYTSQAEALGLSLPGSDDAKLTAEQKAAYLEGMQAMRERVIALQTAIQHKKAEDAKKILSQINEIRKNGHNRFGI
ncbi:MAG: cytochrome b562 [Comamonadaceae bacterium]|nr:cytochrome b562 [Comamonadaceae bacterium]